MSAGARFISSPVNPKGLIDAAHAGGALAIPGGMTPTELLAIGQANIIIPQSSARAHNLLPSLPPSLLLPSFCRTNVFTGSPHDPPHAINAVTRSSDPISSPLCCLVQ